MRFDVSHILPHIVSLPAAPRAVFLMTSRHQNGSLNPRPRQLWRFACTENMRADMLLINESIRNSWQMMKRYRPHNKSKGVPGTSVSRQVLRQTYYKTWSYRSKSCFPTNRMGAEKGNVDLYVSQISKDKIWNTTCSTVKSLTSFIFLESLKLLLVLWIFCCCNWTFSIDIIYNFIFHNKHAKSQNVKVK